MFFLPIIPVAKGRPRFTRDGRCYTPQKTRDYEKAIAEFAAPLFVSPLDGPIKLTIEFYLPRPKALKKPEGRIRHTKRPDLDNLIKAIKDALNGLAWHDDSQVCETISKKYYAPVGHSPGIAFSVEAFDG